MDHKDVSQENTGQAACPATPELGDRHAMLQYLVSLQQRYNHIPPLEISRLSQSLGIGEADIRGVISFYSFLHLTPQGQFEVLFSDNITDRMNGNLSLLDELCAQLGVTQGMPRSDGRVTVGLTSCTGLCEQGPAVLVNRMAIGGMDSQRVREMAGLIESGIPLEQWPSSWFSVPDNIQRKDRLLSAALCHGEALQRWLDEGSDWALAELDNSGLRGRGGAGFTTAAKWRFCRDADADEKFVVCNADEGEPGTFKDRVLLNSYAHSVIEGMTLCAAVTGGQKGFIYLRGEYRHLLPALDDVIKERRSGNLLGDNILNTDGWCFDVEIHLGAGAYICGEESALIESLEGKRGVPRKRPPFPVTSGYKGKPTVVNNVETFMAAALIAVNGAEWFTAVGTQDSPGTKILSVSGDCERPGIYEYPFGVAVQQVLDDVGANHPQAVQIAGAAGSTHPASEFGRRIAFEDISTAGSFMVFDESRGVLGMVENFADFFVHESCGFCTPCRVGGVLLRDLVKKVRKGYASAYDLEEMRHIGGLMREASHCGLGSTAPNAVLDTLEKFPKIYQERLTETDFIPAFELDAALAESRALAERDDPHAHLENVHE